jgi:hypothetical protein
VTRFQLVFRRNGERDQTEICDSNHYDEPHIDGRLIVDGETYVIRGVEWIINGDGQVHADGMKRFICTLAVVPTDATRRSPG